MILAAGVGKRLNGKSDNRICKPLQQVGGVPLIVYSLRLLEKAGIEKAIVVVGKFYNEIRDEIGDRFGNMNVEYRIQHEQKGLVNAILSGCMELEDDVTVLLADELFVNAKMSDCIKEFRDKSLDFIVTYVIENDPEKIKANFSLNITNDGTPYGFVEKPTEVVNDMKGTGVCFFSAESIALLKQKYDKKSNVPNTLCDFFNLLNQEKMNGRAFEFADVEVNVNTPEDLKNAKRMFETEG